MMDHIQNHNAGSLWDKLTAAGHASDADPRRTARAACRVPPLAHDRPRPPRHRRSTRVQTVPATMQALVVLEPNRLEIQEVPVPEPGSQRGPRPGPGGIDLRHRRAPDPRRLPGLLAAGLPVHPGARVGRRDRRPRPGRGALRLEGRRPGGRHLARRLRRLPRSASRAATTSARTTASRVSTASTATTSRAPTRPTSSTASSASSRCPTPSASTRARSSTRPRSRSTWPTAATSPRATPWRSSAPARSAYWPAMPPGSAVPPG